MRVVVALPIVNTVMGPPILLAHGMRSVAEAEAGEQGENG